MTTMEELLEGKLSQHKPGIKSQEVFRDAENRDQVLEIPRPLIDLLSNSQTSGTA